VFQQGPLPSDRESPMPSDEDSLGRLDNHAPNGGYLA